MKKLAFIQYSNGSSFIDADYNILSKHFDMIRVEYNHPQDAFKIMNAIFKSDISFSWFADGWAFFAILFSKLFNKKSVVVVGGYDVACAPEINYGMCVKSKLRQWMSKFALNYADELLSVSNFTKKECLKYLTHPRDLNMIYNGIDTEKFKPNGEKNKTVLTVASGSGSVIKLKGLNTFFEVAKQLPHIVFIIIGLSDGDKEIMISNGIPINIRLIEHVPQQLLIKYYQRAKVYCQLSYQESFGMSLTEAMSCECIPVVSDRGALPEIIGNTGYIIPYDDINTTVTAIQVALTTSVENARQRVIDNFSIKKRESRLLEVLK